MKTDTNETLSAQAASVARGSVTVGDLMRQLDHAVCASRDPRLARAWCTYRLVGNPFEML